MFKIKEKLENMQMELEEPGNSLWKATLHKLCMNRFAVFGIFVLLFLVLFSIFGPYMVAFNYYQQNLSLGASEPSLTHFFGTDQLGRDLLVRMMYGGRVSLAVGICATLVSLTIGVIYGALSGYFGGRVDSVMMRFVDVMYALPFTMLVIVLMVWLGRNFILIFVAIGAIEWLTMARIVRNEVYCIKKKEYIEAARAIGLPGWKILYRHIIPNLLGIVIVYVTLTIPRVMMIEAFLSFLGLGIQPPMSSWGLLIKDGAQVMEEYPWMLFFPSLVFSLTLFSLNFLGDGLRDALDPRSKE
ncbi:MAG TPA: peptide ABC transporter permease [Lentisphaeria bacterium]|nr:MAG: peptide ABC transporter permease [Lentisphaerae bacterium GWF2_38_69]HBM15896.1 peptide ABC transporter permease [Lentisphaeria bacterium]